jgi:hypothetical protein
MVQRTQRTITNDPIPLFSYEKDLFFEKKSNWNWWFQFIRDSQNQVVGMERKHNWLINDKVQKLHKIN